MRYYGMEFFPLIRDFTDGVKNDYLSIRKANVVLK
jgi:hypothetical protein